MLVIAVWFLPLQVLQQYHRHFQHVLVDEFQDTNTAQYQLVRLMCDANSTGTSLFMVGDPNQVRCLTTDLWLVFVTVSSYA